MLVTLEQAAEHLRIDEYLEEAPDLLNKVKAASEIVLNYVEMTEADLEDSSGNLEVPFALQSATLLLVGDLHRYRSSDMPKYNDAFLPSSVRALLYPLKTWGL